MLVSCRPLVSLWLLQIETDDRKWEVNTIGLSTVSQMWEITWHIHNMSSSSFYLWMFTMADYCWACIGRMWVVCGIHRQQVELRSWESCSNKKGTRMSLQKVEHDFLPTNQLFLCLVVFRGILRCCLLASRTNSHIKSFLNLVGRELDQHLISTQLPPDSLNFLVFLSCQLEQAK